MTLDCHHDQAPLQIVAVGIVILVGPNLYAWAQRKTKTKGLTETDIEERVREWRDGHDQHKV